MTTFLESIPIIYVALLNMVCIIASLYLDWRIYCALLVKIAEKNDIIDLGVRQTKALDSQLVKMSEMVKDLTIKASEVKTVAVAIKTAVVDSPHNEVPR